jgi:uncharacterized membrane protein
MEEQYKTNAGQGFGITGLVVGIIALIVSFIPCIGLLALLPALIAIVFSIVALTQANRGQGAKGLIIAAIVVSSLAFLVSVGWAVYFTREVDTVKIKDKIFELDKNLKHLKELEIDTAHNKLDKLEDNMDKLQGDSTKSTHEKSNPEHKKTEKK